VKYIIFQTKILIKPALGIYLITDYYNDGSVKEHESRLGPIIIYKPLIFY